MVRIEQKVNLSFDDLKALIYREHSADHPAGAMCSTRAFVLQHFKLPLWTKNILNTKHQ